MPRAITKSDMPAPKPRGNKVYDWDAMFDGVSIGDFIAFDKGDEDAVEAGEADFSCLATSFAVLAREEAKERGLRLSLPGLDREDTTVRAEVKAPKPDTEASDEDTTDES